MLLYKPALHVASMTAELKALLYKTCGRTPKMCAPELDRI